MRKSTIIFSISNSFRFLRDFFVTFFCQNELLSCYFCQTTFLTQRMYVEKHLKRKFYTVMIRFKLFHRILLLPLFSVMLFSCEEEDVPLVAIGDVFIQSVRINDTVQYGLCYFAYSSDKMEKATVFKEGDDLIISLDSVKGRYTYIHYPDSLEFKTSKPLRAKYIFDVDFDNGEHYETSDFLDSVSLKPVKIKECRFDKEGLKIIVDWEGSSLADQYVVNLKTNNNEIVFKSEVFNLNQTFLWIYSYSNGWLNNKQPIGGEKYKVTITAYQATSYPSALNLQSVSVAESDYVHWIVEND